MALLTASCSGGQEVSAPEDGTTIPGGGASIAAASPTTAAPPPAAEPDTDPATLYVDPVGGDDEADGQTTDTAWLTLQAALDRLQPGNRLHLMDGDHVGVVQPGVAHHILAVDGTADAWITITAAPGHEPTILATAGHGIEVRGDYVELSGIRVRGDGFDVDNSYGWGIQVRESHHVRLRDNVITGMPTGGISAVESSNLEVLDNEIFENAYWDPAQGSGISIWHSADRGQPADPDGYHDRILGNTIYRNENKVFSINREDDIVTDGNGIIIDQSKETGYTGRTLVANNVVFDNGGRGILVLESSRVDVMFNTTHGNGWTDALEGGAVELAAGRADDVRFLNNLAWSLPGAPALTVSDSTGVETGGNLLVTDNPSGFATELDVVTTDDPGLIAAGIDPATADFRPLADSLVVDRAIGVSPALPYDADGVSRSGQPADVGAYELAP